MSFNRGRVERKRDGIFAGLGQRFKDRAPSSALCPTIEAIVDRRVRPVFRRTIAPPRTRLQHLNDAADNAPIVVPIRSVPSAGAVLSAPTAYHSTKTGRHASLVPESKYADKRITWR